LEREGEIVFPGNPLSFFKTGPDRPVLEEPTQIRRIYESKRLTIFLSLVFGYSMFYVCRLGFAVAKKPMLDEGILNAKEMGDIGSALFFTYAFGKLVNGFLADRSNIARIVATGLLGSAVIIVLFGFTKVYFLFLVLWGINGWFQSMGAAPCGASISQWFSNRERGTRYGIWSTAHSMGEALSFYVTAALIAYFGWRWGLWSVGLFSALIALVMYHTLGDRPQTYGLPPIADYKNDHATDSSEAQTSVGRAQLEVLRNPYVWILGMSSVAMYIGRYGINSWGVLYLQEAKSYTLVTAGTVLTCAKVMETIGALSSGFISDFLFRSRRNVTTLIYGLIQVAGLIILFMASPVRGAGNQPMLLGRYGIWDLIGASCFGFGLGGMLVFIGGLIAIDICSKKASGAAMGVVGMFSYLGASLQESVSGRLIEAGKMVVNGESVHDFTSAYLFWLGAAVIAVLLSCTLWNVKQKE
jgi:OPA family sugar phosphate sensor protein UhpC-like MFS transporter